jgi:Nucleotidyl transferase AbiEii toxin, Type IV TA system
VAGRLVSPFSEAIITDVAEKRWTYLCEIRIVEGYLPQPFRVKLEISRRAASGYQTELRLITSPSTPLQVLGRVATLDQLYRDKIECVKGRDAAKDIFDLWFIAQKLKVPYSPPETSMSRQELNRDLGKYLPAGYRNVIKDLL